MDIGGFGIELEVLGWNYGQVLFMLVMNTWEMITSYV